MVCRYVERKLTVRFTGHRMMYDIPGTPLEVDRQGRGIANQSINRDTRTVAGVDMIIRFEILYILEACL